MHRLTVFMVIALFALPAFAAQPRLDSEQVNIEAPANTVVGGSPRQKLAQAFTVVSPGFLDAIAIPIGCQPAATLLVTIEETTAGVPNGIVLARESVAGT